MKLIDFKDYFICEVICVSVCIVSEVALRRPGRERRFPEVGGTDECALPVSPDLGAGARPGISARAGSTLNMGAI